MLPGDIRQLPCKEREAEAIRAIDVLEHISWREVNATLAHWFSRLQSGGTLEIRCPDILEQARCLLDGRWNAATFSLMMFGGQDAEGNFHKAGFTPDSLAQALEAVGFVIVSLTPEYDAIPIAGNANFRVVARRP